MNRTHKKRLRLFIEALRSGRYKQTQDTLRRGDCFCAEGVLCDVYRRHAKKGRWVRVSDSGSPWHLFSFRLDGGPGITVAPGTVDRWFGFGPEQPSRLIHMNDTRKLTFKQIARNIERRFL